MSWIAEYEAKRRRDAAKAFARSVISRAQQLEPETLRWLGWRGIEIFERAIVEICLESIDREQAPPPEDQKDQKDPNNL